MVLLELEELYLFNYGVSDKLSLFVWFCPFDYVCSFINLQEFLYAAKGHAGITPGTGHCHSAPFTRSFTLEDNLTVRKAEKPNGTRMDT